MNYKKIHIPIIFILTINLVCVGQISNLVSIDSEGNLQYTADANGNVIPDFSMVGYHQGGTEIPNVPVEVILNPDVGDRYSDIQNAINYVSTLNPNPDGHRGAILLTAGIYEVSQTLIINTSGIVIRGEGSDENGTIIKLTAATQINLFDIHGSSNVTKNESTTKQITDIYVPIGKKTITIESGHSFQIGDRVIFTLRTNEDWISLLGMDQLETICGEGHSNWNPGSTDYKRKVTNVVGNQITLDAPIVDPVDSAYNYATLTKYSWSGKIEECGVENIRLLSTYASEIDENHGWAAIEFRNIENAWVNHVNAYYFGYGCVSVRSGAYQITVQNCGMNEYKSKVSGGRRYGFNSDDCDLILFKNCTSDKGRHDFVQGSKTPGPNVYTNCTATNSASDSGPHHRWSTGTLWDNISTDNNLNVQNRLCSGSGHGWAGAQQVFWNCTANKIILHDPPSLPTNWAIGCIANITNDGDYNNVEEPIGVVESINIPIANIPSLYEAQLLDRLNNSVSTIDNPIHQDNLFIYPNPVKDELFIKILGNDVSVRIYNSWGQLVFNEPYVNNISVSSLKSGLYHIHIIEGNKRIKATTFIKE